MSAFAWADGSFSLRVAVTLLHLLWQGLAVAFLVIVAGRQLKRSAAQARYSINVAAMLVMVACLPVTFALVDVSDHRLPEFDLAGARAARSPSATAEMRPVEPGGAADHRQWSSSAQHDEIVREGESLVDPATADAIRGGYREASPARDSLASRHAERQADPAPGWIMSAAWYLTWGYFAGVLIMTLRLALGLRGGQKLRRASTKVDDPILLTMLGHQARRLGLRMAPAMALCRQVSVPVVIGIVRPMILLPATLASGLSPNQLQALVTHELAHIRRFDLLVNLLQRWIEAVLFFHPAVWFVSRRVSTERENAADDMVLAAGWQPASYADALVRMAELSSTLRGTRLATQVAALAASGAGATDFKRRVLRLLETTDKPQLRLPRSGLVSIALVAVSLLAAPVIVQSQAEVPTEQPEDEQERLIAILPDAEQSDHPPGRPTADKEESPPGDDDSPAAADAADDETEELKRRADAAIGRAADYLIARQNDDGSWSSGMTGDAYRPGATALAALALRDTGPKSKKALRRAGQYLLKASPEMTKQVALQTLFLHGMGKRGAAVCRRNVKWLIAAQLKQGPDAGSWSYGGEGPARSRGDGANTAYALQALAVAAPKDPESPNAIPPKVWQRAAQWLVRNQKADGGWGYSRGSPSTGSMTVCALSNLKSLKSRCDEDEGIAAAATRGHKWLAGHWNVRRETAAQPWRLFYLEWMSAALSDRAEFAGRHWYPEVLDSVLPEQRKDGSFQPTPPSSTPVVGTAFALGILKHSANEKLLKSGD